MFPELERVKEIAQSGDYGRIPVGREIYADRYTPIEVMRTLKAASRHCYLLESAHRDEKWGRYSFLGYSPLLEVTCVDGLLKIQYLSEDMAVKGEATFTDHPNEKIREILQKYRSPKMAGFPSFTGGLVGYFSYDYLKYAEPILRKKTEKGEDLFRDVDLMLFDKVIVFDHYRQKLLLIGGVDPKNLESSYESAQMELDEMERLLNSGAKADFRPLHLREELEPVYSQTEYCHMVEQAKHYIKEGDIFQVVLSNPLRAEADGSLFDTYRVLRTANPSPYMFYFSSDDIEVAEHNMLVDLGRNDLGKISKLGTVKVEQYLGIERFSHVMHIGSTVEGQIREDRDALDAVDAVLPAGTLSGAPKIRACQIIQELEREPRGIYGGAIGYLDFTGNLDVCISIRLAYKKNGKVCVQSGAGIVADSVPEREFTECTNKARAVVQALREAEGGGL